MHTIKSVLFIVYVIETKGESHLLENFIYTYPLNWLLSRLLVFPI